jgi:hypothetical protein
LLEGEDASAGRDFWRRQRASDPLILPHEGRAQLQPFAAHASVELTFHLTRSPGWSRWRVRTRLRARHACSHVGSCCCRD